MPRIAVLLITAFLSLAAHAAEPRGLLELFRLAQTHDNAWAAAQKRYQATLEAYPIARSALLPSVGASASYGRTHRELEQAFSDSERNYTQETQRLQVRQPLINLERLARVRMSRRDVGVGELELALARQDLIQRVVEAYLGLLLAQERIALVDAQITAIDAQMRQAEKLRQGGVATRTDVLEARVLLDRARADRIEAGNQLDIARRQLFMITGVPDATARALGDNAQFLPPQPNQPSAWLQDAFEQALEVRAGVLTVERAHLDVQRSRSQHLPTLDAVASYDRSSNTDLGATKDTIGRVGVELNIPLYTGGRISAEVREAAARREYAQEQLELARRRAELEAGTAFSEITNSLARITALEQAVHSSETALHAAEMSYSVAYRTFVDVLNAQQLLFRSRFDLLGARFDYIIGLLRLNAAVGALGEALVEEVDSWLVADDATDAATSPATGATTDDAQACAHPATATAQGGAPSAAGAPSQPCAPAARADARLTTGPNETH